VLFVVLLLLNYLGDISIINRHVCYLVVLRVIGYNVMDHFAQVLSLYVFILLIHVNPEILLPVSSGTTGFRYRFLVRVSLALRSRLADWSVAKVKGARGLSPRPPLRFEPPAVN